MAASQRFSRKVPLGAKGHNTNDSTLPGSGRPEDGELHNSPSLLVTILPLKEETGIGKVLRNEN